MNIYDPNLHQQHRTLKAIEARMARHEKATRMILILVIVMAAVASSLLLKAIS
jgi:hypothetical protein